MVGIACVLTPSSAICSPPRASDGQVTSIVCGCRCHGPAGRLSHAASPFAIFVLNGSHSSRHSITSSRSCTRLSNSCFVKPRPVYVLPSSRSLGKPPSRSIGRGGCQTSALLSDFLFVCRRSNTVSLPFLFRFGFVRDR